MIFDFSIFEIKAGWFDIRISNGEEAMIITNSDYMGNDAPRILLRNLTELYLLKKEVRWLCWHDEPGAYIWRLEKNGEQISYQIFDTPKPSYQLVYEGLGLADQIAGEAVLQGIAPVKQFTRRIFKALSEYATGDRNVVYLREWGAFPAKELEDLREVLKRKNIE